MRNPLTSSSGAPMKDGLPGSGRKSLRAWVGITLVLLGIGAVVVSTAFDEPQIATPLGDNRPINEGASDPADISSHNSPTLVRNPRREANLVVANRIDTPRFACALQVSVDGGASWSQTPVPAPVGERSCYSPDVTFDTAGTLYLSFVTLSGRENAPNAVWIATSTDGGRTLSAPVKAQGALAFQVRLVADPVEPERLYMTWVQASEVGLFRFTEPGNPIRAARSDDGGATWSSPARVSAFSRARVVAPASAVGPEGELYVLYLDLGEDLLDYAGAHRGMGGPPHSGSWQLVLARSRDQGESWEESVVEDRLAPSERFVVFTPPFPSLAVDRDSGRLYAGFHDGRLGDRDVWVWSSESAGESWEAPTRVNDTPQRDETSQYLPKLAVAPGGRLDVLYYDRRSDSDDVITEVSLQSSSDAGESFGRRVRVSDERFDSRIGYGSERSLPDLGSRLGLLSTDSRALALWTDTRAGTQATNKQDLAGAVVAFSDPERLPTGVAYLLRFGGAALALIGLLLVGPWAFSGGRSVLRRRGS